MTWVGRLARSEGAAAVLVAGDFFDNPRGSQIRRRLDRAVEPVLRSWGCPVLGIRGNHDVEHGRADALVDHPLGELEATGVVRIVGPDPAQGVVVGDVCRVMVMGYDYRREGPLDYLRRQRLERARHIGLGPRDYRNCHFAVLLTHCFWGDTTGTIYGEPVVGVEEAVGTDFDVVAHGHDHRCFGVRWVESLMHPPVAVVGPGALLRGSLAEEDVQRQPMVAVMRFTPGHRPDVQLEVVPCEAAAVVFDLARHAEERNAANVVSEFTEALQRHRVDGPSEDAWSVLAPRVTGAVLQRAQQYVDRARQHLDTLAA